MTNPYTRDLGTPSRPDSYIDRAALARDLAPLLGATYTPDMDGEGRYCVSTLRIGDMHLTLSGCHGAEWKRVRISAFPARELAEKVRNLSGVPTIPHVTVDPSRPLPVLVADLKRRLLEPAAPLIEKVRSMADGLDRGRTELQGHVDRISTMFPGLRISIKPGYNTAELYFYGPTGVSFSGDLLSDGHISLQRVSGLTPDRTDAILSALTA